MSTETTNTQLVPLDNPAATYETTEAALQKIESEYGKLTIAGTDDKDGYKAVSSALREVIGLRNKIDKRRLDLKRQIDTNAKTIIGRLAPIEEHLSAQKQTVDAELERIKQEKAEAERIKFVARTQKLFDLGFVFNGVIYTLGHHGLLPSVVNDLPEDVWAANVSEYEVTAKAIAEAKAAQEAELKRLRELAAKQTVETNIEAAKRQGAIAQGKVDSVEVTETTTTVNTSVLLNNPPKTITVPVSFKEQVNVGETKPARSTEYIEGFQSCRNAILAILASPEQLTRKIIIERINNLNP